MFRDDVALAIAAISAVCLLILTGGYVYSGGDLLPSAETDGVDSWIFSFVLFAFPVATLCDLLVRGTRRLRKRK